ncbi:hypothetical protein LJK88_46915 [Paenibacillus sp. P26]|nr:hypothetical protein LJK88_46915 [Paenibacillus sp. P26]
MVAVVYSLLWILAAWRMVDWRNWRLLYPTAVFSALGNALYEVVCSRYPLWAMEANGSPNATPPALLLILIGMPLSTMIFLSHYPGSKSLGLQALYIAVFIVLFDLLEYISVRLGAITYHHGWNLVWSTLFVVVMFPILRVHYKNPAAGIGLSACAAFGFAALFGVGFDKMK